MKRFMYETKETEKWQLVYESLSDELSRKIYLARSLYSLTCDRDYLKDIIRDMPLGMAIRNAANERYNKKLALVGAGEWAEYILRFFPEIHWDYVADNYKAGKTFGGLDIITPGELYEKTAGSDVSVVISILDGYDELISQLVELGFPRESITSVGAVACKHQYFDLPALNLSDNEVKDEDLAESLLLAIRAGASMCDIMGDMFGRAEMELSRDEAVIGQQRELVRQVHDLGGEALLSSHTWVPMSVAQTVEHAKALASRGADMVKIAMIANTEEEVMETFRSTMILKHEMDTPYFLVCMGQYGKLHRQLAPMFGSCLALCVEQYTARSHKDQALLRATRAVLDNVDWIPARDTSIGTAPTLADY